MITDKYSPIQITGQTTLLILYSAFYIILIYSYFKNEQIYDLPKDLAIEMRYLYQKETELSRFFLLIIFYEGEMIQHNGLE